MDWKREKELALSLYILEEEAYEKYTDAMDAYSRGDIAAASEIVALDGRNPMLLGTAFSLLGLHRAAIFCYSQAIDGADPYPHYYMAGDYLALGERVEAIDSLRLALRIAEQDIEYEALEKAIYQFLKS